MADLFGNEVIRTLGLYQPYAQLMLHGKIESRWIKMGKKPPFPLGRYLLYATKKSYSIPEFNHIAGKYADDARQTLKGDQIFNGYAIGIGKLVKVQQFDMRDGLKAWVDIEKLEPELQHKPYIAIDYHILWGLHFEDVQRVNPFPFKGKQGVGFLDDELKKRIQIIT